MSVAISPNETVTVLRLSGDVSLGDMDGILSVLTDMVLHNKNKVILNFQKVSHVSLGAISKLTERNQRFRALGGEIKIVGLIPYVVNLFKLVGAFSNFDIAFNEEEAVARFES